MIVLQASHIAKQFDGTDVLLDASVVVQSFDRVALIGHNGAGKSTLLRILTGELPADAGAVHVSKRAQIGYVSQFVDTTIETTVYDYVAEVFAHLRTMEQHIRRLEHDMATPAVYGHSKRFEEISAEYADLVQKFETLGGYAMDARLRRVLDGMQFPPAMHTQTVSSLSGGQKTRLSLARLLAWQPDVLIMDEPTNYLDTDTLTWLEDFLKSYPGALVIVSHDRFFLDSVATLVVELEDGRTKAYPGNYSTYIEAKSAQMEADLKRFETEQQEIARLNTFVEKNIVRASTTKRAQSRRKLLDKMVRMDKPSSSVRKIALSFQCNRTSGKDVLRLQGVAVGYPDKTLVRNVNLYVARGGRLAIIGPNGIGKTTLLSTLVHMRQPLSGDITWGAHVDLGYYDQEQVDLDLSKTVLEQVWDEHPTLDTTTIRTALGRFLFRGEEVNKPVSGLSGGERSRLNLCRLMLKGTNVLILDEPTNHLDLLAKEVLEDALEDYEGTIVFVSHDRYFIDAIATHVAVIDSDGADVYIGNYTDYLEKRRENERIALEEAELAAGTAAAKRGAVSADPQKSADNETGRVRLRSSDVRKAREKVAALETDIARIEARQTRIATELSDAAIAQEVTHMRSLRAESEVLDDEYEHAMSAWENALANLESLENAK